MQAANNDNASGPAGELGAGSVFTAGFDDDAPDRGLAAGSLAMGSAFGGQAASPPARAAFSPGAPQPSVRFDPSVFKDDPPSGSVYRDPSLFGNADYSATVLTPHRERR